MKKIKEFFKKDEIEVIDPEIVETEEENEEETEMNEKKGISKRTKLIVGGTAAGLLAIAGALLFKKSKSDDFYELEEVDPDSEYYDEETEESDEIEDAEGGSDEE